MRALAAKPEVGNDFRFFLLYWEIAQGQRGEGWAFAKLVRMMGARIALS